MKKWIFIVFLFIVAAGAALVYFQGREFTFVLSESELQENVDEGFPLEERVLGVMSLRLFDPEIGLVEGTDRIDFGVSVALSLGPLGGDLSGRGQISGRVRYDPDEASFYLDDAIVEELAIERIPPGYEAEVRAAATLLARRQLERMPVYRIAGVTVRQIATMAVLKRAEVVEGEFLVTLEVPRFFGVFD